MEIRVLGALALGVILGASGGQGAAWAAGKGNVGCDKAACPAGTKVAVTARRGEPYFMCPTLELARYSNTVLGLISMQKMMGGGMANVSSQTGEPEYQGETKRMLDGLRAAAKVSTFDQAAAKCAYGKDTSGLTIMNAADDQYIWVGNQRSNFWVPRFAAHRAGR